MIVGELVFVIDVVHRAELQPFLSSQLSLDLSALRLLLLLLLQRIQSLGILRSFRSYAPTLRASVGNP